MFLSSVRKPREASAAAALILSINRASRADALEGCLRRAAPRDRD